MARDRRTTGKSSAQAANDVLTVGVLAFLSPIANLQAKFALLALESRQNFPAARTRPASKAFSEPEGTPADRSFPA